MKKIVYFFTVAILMVTMAKAQVGVGTTTPNADAALDVTNTSKGLLLPRVALSGTTSASPMSAHVAGMVVYNTATTGDVTPGLYINDGTKWKPLSTAVSTAATFTAASINCFSGSAPVGTYQAGVAMTSSNTKQVSMTCTFPGTYTGTTDTQNGVTFTASGTLYASGTNTAIPFTANGTPITNGTFPYTLSLGGGTCTFPVTFTSPASFNCIGSSQTLTPATLFNAGTYTGTYSIPYTGGNGASYAATSQTVSGLTLTRVAGTYAAGGGTVVYNLAGTYTGANYTSASFTVAEGCTVSFGYSVPSTINLGNTPYYFLTSVHDDHYLPYTTATGPATLTTNVNPSGGTANTLVNVQGTITTTGTSVGILCTATGSGTLPAYSTTFAVPASSTQDGIGRTLTLSWPATAYTTATKFITATISSAGGAMNAYQMDINSGIGNDNLGFEIANFTYPYTVTGSTYTLSLRDIAAIPDRTYNTELYMPINSPSGKVWLNNNLGADYSNTAKASFSPTQQATSYTDWHAYGSSYEWGRLSDGHELVNWTAATTYTAVNPSVATQSTTDVPGNALYIYGFNDWRNPSNNNLWQGVNGTNNPCPVGFRLPTLAEYNTEITANSITNPTTGASSIFKFTGNGVRQTSNSTFLITNSEGYYWTSTISTSTTVTPFYMNSGTATTTVTAQPKAEGILVRCIKD